MIISRKTQQRIDKISEATFCITIGTLIGLITYELFLISHIDIFGWNLGLIFAPLIAGYSETQLAKIYMGETTGAVSAFILFAVTTVYSFLIANPTLGVNVITIGSLFVILQAALPTLINYFIIIIIISVVSYISGVFKKISSFLYNKSIGKLLFKSDEYFNKPVESAVNYDESLEVNINNLGIIILSTQEIENYTIIKQKGTYEGKVIYKSETSVNRENYEKQTLNDLTKAKNQAIMSLAETAKKHDCNLILDLNLEYEILDNRGSTCLVVATGTGLIIE